MSWWYSRTYYFLKVEQYMFTIVYCHNSRKEYSSGAFWVHLACCATIITTIHSTHFILQNGTLHCKSSFFAFFPSPSKYHSTFVSHTRGCPVVTPPSCFSICFLELGQGRRERDILRIFLRCIFHNCIYFDLSLEVTKLYTCMKCGGAPHLYFKDDSTKISYMR